MTGEDALRTSTYLSVYGLLDELCFVGQVPARSTGTLHRAVDSLRRLAAPAEDIRTAEAVSVAVHRLTAALRLGDRATQDEARRQLRELGGRWLQTPMRLTLN